ncbi:PRC-barrel domain-containing protein [Paenibacillus sp. J2TS4]|uniref:PRC-barrel domain-containing protein n=1 Tax=Paenibacillus sp. J2TS4 TaxID=2807194 RepID=UPI001B1EFA11|nr:PRC-barrel domain-containing protein [Paenibacillus sp. J2TS4]GIP31437.1 hypothetical protein J2TS4_06470 [Paenibacillus sp. J2TS4]
MRRANDMLGLPVIDVQSGKQLGTVKDLLIDPEWLVQGIILDTRHWFSSPRFILWEDIASYGEDAVTVEGEDVIRMEEDTPDSWVLLSGSGKIIGLPLLTVNGQQLGRVEDVYFSPKMDKKIIGFELSEGFLSDVKEGRKWLPAPAQATMGQDVIIVPVSSKDELEENLYEE